MADEEVSGWTDAEIHALAMAMIEDNDIVTEHAIEVSGVEFTFRWLNMEETEKASRACERDDMLTRELHWQREILSRAIIKVGGRPVAPLVIMRFLNAAPPPMVEKLYTEFVALRKAQGVALERIYAEIKK